MGQVIWSDVKLRSDIKGTKVVYTLDILFSSNHNIHKCSCELCFWASDPVIDRFY